MWFKNLQLFRVPESWDLSAEDLASQLRHFAFQPCSSLAMESRGWIPPRGDDQLLIELHRQWLIALGVEQKLLPASVVRQTVKERAAGLESKVGRKVGRKELRVVYAGSRWRRRSWSRSSLNPSSSNSPWSCQMIGSAPSRRWSRTLPLG